MKSMIGEWAEYDEIEIRQRIEEMEMAIVHAKIELLRRSKVLKSNYSRKERKEQICRLLADGRIRSTSDIARSIGMQPSNHLRNILCELYADGKILGYADKIVAKHSCYYWYVQSTLPLPFPVSSVESPCQSITEAVEFPF